MTESDLDAPGPGSWARRAPLVPLVMGLGVAITLFAWLGLRSVEREQAGVDYERQLLAQSSELQSEIRSYVRSIDGLRALLDIDGSPSDSQVVRYLESVDLADDRIIYVETATAEQPAVIRRAFGFEGADSLSGATLEGTAVLRPIALQAALLGDTTVVTEPDIDALFPPVAASGEVGGDPDVAGPTLTLVGAVGIDDDTARGLVISQLALADLFDAISGRTASGAPLALELSVDETSLATTMSANDLGQPFGDPVVFTEEETLWTIQGFEAGIVVDRGQSSLAAVVGLLVSLLGGLVARATRRHAITLGRLQRSEHDAKHDDLTGLLNRSGLTEELGTKLGDRRGGDLVGVLFLDLDRLKVVNDSIGHSAGDEVLMAVAERLRRIVREGDVVGRFGGDEFVVVSSGVPAISDLTMLADRVLEVLKEPAVLSDQSAQMISASIGIAYVTKGEASAEDLLRDADVAMYRAKDQGGSQYAVFDSELRDQAVARLEVERELRRAIRTGQLVVHYQPIVDTETGGVDRLEALVRWQHPERGMIPPGAFLSVAAESGLIVDLGEHVLRESCRQAALWSAAVGRDIMVSVNVAERQLIDTSLVDTVRRVLSETGIKPSQLELEITEELIVDRLDHRLTVLHDLVAMGIKLAIDDFGTSRASLGQLKKLDMVSTLKIDRAFVIDVATDVVDRKIITAIVALADSVGMEIVAEGVEDADQAAVLRQLGVGLIQGFYFQRPADASHMATVINKTFEVPAPATLLDA